MFWFALFAATVFGLYFWREHRIQQQDLQSATAPHRVGERYIGQVLTLSDGIREGEGRVKLGLDEVPLRAGQLAVLGDGDRAVASADGAGRFLLVSARPLDEPVARRGPFVMNTDAEIQQAFDDYRSGRLVRL